MYPWLINVGLGAIAGGSTGEGFINVTAATIYNTVQHLHQGSWLGFVSETG